MSVVQRPVVRIDEELCDGCGECVPSCEEGAIVIENGKARLVAERLCDGLGACIGHCPRGAITVIERPADAFDASAVAEHLARRASGVGAPARLPSLDGSPAPASAGGGCPGSLSRRLEPLPAGSGDPGPRKASALRQWPVQLRLIAPNAAFLRDADLLLAADCAGFAMPGFHGDALDGRALAIACPKLDTQLEDYVARLVAMIDQGGVRSIHVLVMEVPCCRGLWGLAEQAVRLARREVPLSAAIVGTDGTLRA